MPNISSVLAPLNPVLVVTAMGVQIILQIFWHGKRRNVSKLQFSRDGQRVMVNFQEDLHLDRRALGILQTRCQCILQTAATHATGATEGKDHDNDSVPCAAVKKCSSNCIMVPTLNPAAAYHGQRSNRVTSNNKHSDYRTSTQMRWQPLGRLNRQALNKNPAILKWGPQVKVVWQNWYSRLEKAFICAEGLAPIYTGIRTAVALNLSYSLPNMLTVNIKNMTTV